MTAPIAPAIWTCTIGHRGIGHDALPPGCDQPMREAAAAAFREITGRDNEFVFSGWGQTYLPENWAAVVDGRNVLLDDTHFAAWTWAREVVAHALGEDHLDGAEDQRVSAAVSALTELLWARR